MTNKITEGHIGDLKILADFLKERGINVSRFDIIDFEEDEDMIKILIDGWISIKKSEYDSSKNEESDKQKN